MRVDDLIVEVRSKNYQRVGVIRPEDLDIELLPLANGVGTWKVTLPVEHHLCAALRTPGAGIIVTGPNFVISGPAIAPEMQATPEDNQGIVTIEGVTDDCILSDYLAWPEPSNPDVTAQTLSHDERTGIAETLMHEYVDANVGPSAPDERRHQYLTLGTDGARGDLVTKKARFPLLGELLGELAAPYGLGFQVVQRDSVLAFETYERHDHTAVIRLSMSNKGIAGAKVKTSAPGLTRAIVAGGGQLVDRLFVERTSTDSVQAEADWGRRIERFIDQRQTVDQTELDQAGDEALAEEGFTGIDAQVVPSENTNMKFGTDWYLGDRITVEVEGIENQATVLGAAIRADSDGVKIGILLGEMTAFVPANVSTGGVNPNVLQQRISNLERESGNDADTGWINATLQNSWVNFDVTTHQAAQYRRIGKRVIIRGVVKNGSSITSTVLTLPAGFRPTLKEIGRGAASVSGNHRGVRVDVLADGQVQCASADAATTYLSFCGLEFFTD